METYWLESAMNNKTKEEVNSLDDENVVVQRGSLLVTSL